MSDAVPAFAPVTADHLPLWMAEGGGTDVLFYFMLVFLVAAVFGVGLIYLRLHALPEHLAHGESKVKLQLVGVLALLALFTHNHLFWIAGLLLAIVRFPDFSAPLGSMAGSLAKLAERAPPPPPTSTASLREIVEMPPPRPTATTTERRG